MGSNESSGRRPYAARDGDVWERDINNNLTGRTILRAPQPLDDLSDELPGSNASSERRPDVVQDVGERHINNNLTGRGTPRALQELRWSLDVLSDALPGSNASSERRPVSVRDEDVWERDINNNLRGRRIPRAPQPLDDLSDELPASNASSERRPDVVQDVGERDINNNLTGRGAPRALQELRWSLDELSDELPNPFFKRPTLCECCTRWTHFICGVCHTCFCKTPTENEGGEGLPKKRLTDCIPLEYPECPYCHSFSTMVDVDYKNYEK